MAIGYGVAVPKPEPSKCVKRRKQRAEKKVEDAVRAHCVERDKYCRCSWGKFGDPKDVGFAESGDCDGPSEWAHMHVRRRSKTRGMAPAVRHDTKHSLCLCRRHHDQYDGRQYPRLQITALTRKGCDGPLRFRMKVVK